MRIKITQNVFFVFVLECLCEGQLYRASAYPEVALIRTRRKKKLKHRTRLFQSQYVTLPKRFSNVGVANPTLN